MPPANNVTVPFPGAVTDLIAAQAKRTPDRIAMTWSGGEAWTYARLVQTVDAIAGWLIACGIKRGDLVGVYLPRRPEMVAAVLGVMRAGAAYLPLDPVFPEKRLGYMAGHARVRHILVWRENDLPDRLASCSKPLALERFALQPALNVALPALTGEDLAYALYTSGSTGLPKGVRTLHSNLTNFLTSMLEEPGIAADDVMGAFTTLSYDASVEELFPPLMVGARLVVASETEQADTTAMSALMRNQPMTVLETSPLMLRLMLASDRIHELRGLKLWVGGEALPRDLAEQVLSECHELWNVYGPTETTVTSTLHRVTHGDGPVPIGKPLANTAIYLLDAELAPVEDGGIGEIWIGGAGVADGYLNDPERTAERFIPDPFATDGSRMYRTGDLGSLQGGVYYCHGRVDDQINVHGARVEPGEIEAVAQAEAGVHQAVAVTKDLGDGDLRLVLYVVADPDPELVPRLRAAMRTSLPQYMWPRHIETLDALPSTLNGKVDRKALPLPKAVIDYNAASVAHDPVTSPPDAGQADEWSPLVPIQPRGQRPPLFLVHGVGGKVLDYVPLGRGLGADQPVYGIQAIGLDGLTAPVGSITTMAACYVAEIQRVQSHGPYFLGGHSMGALVAFEVAQQLHEQGEFVALLALIDTSSPGYQHTGRPPGHNKSPFGRLRQAIDALRVRRARTARRALPPVLLCREIERVHSRAMLNYRAQTYSGRVVLLRTSIASPDSDDAATLGWKHAIPNRIEVFELPDSRGTLIEQPGLLRQLRNLLEDAQSSAAPTAAHRGQP